MYNDTIYCKFTSTTSTINKKNNLLKTFHHTVLTTKHNLNQTAINI